MIESFIERDGCLLTLSPTHFSLVCTVESAEQLGRPRLLMITDMPQELRVRYIKTGYLPGPQ